jgi:hypothetical protein
MATACRVSRYAVDLNHVPLAALLALSSIVRAETNYCHDPETNATWEQIKRSHRGERDVEALYALRLQLYRRLTLGRLA